MTLSEKILRILPKSLRNFIFRHAELVKFALVGGTAMIIDAVIYYLLAGTILENKVTIAKVISGVIATVYSYFANTWFSFKNRGGLKRHQESILFFLISGLGVIIQSIPIFFVNNVWHIRENFIGSELKIFDFFINYIFANILQMVFRFWALRKFAYPDIKKPMTAETEIPKG